MVFCVTPLMAASRKGQRDVVKILFENGADITLVSVEVYTYKSLQCYVQVLLTSRPIGTYADIKREARGRALYIRIRTVNGRNVSNLCHRRCALLGRS